jgi:hypothetical protein
MNPHRRQVLLGLASSALITPASPSLRKWHIRYPAAAAGTPFVLGLQVTGALYWYEKHRGFRPKDVAKGLLPIKAIRIWNIWYGNTGVGQWRHINTARSVYNWNYLDRYIALMNAWGVTDIIYTMGGTPAWARAADDNEDMPPDNMADWEAWCRALLTRYRGKIKAYGIWNEPDSSSYWDGTMVQLADMGRRLYAIKQAVDPAALILSPEFQGHNTTKFKQYVAAAGGRDWDVFACHPYRRSKLGWQETCGGYVTALTELGLAARPRWVTEAGFNANYHDGPGDKWLRESVEVVKATSFSRYIHYEYADVNWGKMFNESMPPADGGPVHENAIGAEYRRLIAA